MGEFQEKLVSLYRSKWLVFVAAMWLQSCGGIGYLFGSISPVIKESLNYNQKQLSMVGMAKDLGDSVGFVTDLCSNIYRNKWRNVLQHSVLVSCVQNFPKSRGPVVGIPKEFAGLSGAILTQIYAVIHSPDHTSLIFMVDVGPAMVGVGLMFIVQPVGGRKQVRLCPSDDKNFAFIYGVCLLLAAYLMGVMIVHDLVYLSNTGITIFTIILFLIFFVPFAIPILLAFGKSGRGKAQGSGLSFGARKAKANGAVAIEASLSSSRRSIIDNLRQISQSLGYKKAHIFISLVSIWNFLGRVGGGYVSELLVGDYAYPRPAALAVFQLIMTFGHVFITMGWPGSMYVSTLLIILGYGAHWAIVPATASELFGLRNFGSLYNFITLSNPMGTLVFSSIIASKIYDYEAEKQARGLHASDPLECNGSICFFLTSIIMAGLCIVGALLCMVLVFRTKIVYANLYRKSSRHNFR
ncbi:Protein NUCLEAR FUSION DEFECTIVE [Arachis hypogaea]|nr:Protein NUCLEAR FUSION DEFECTIVE [Arachis hypogaea]